MKMELLILWGSSLSSAPPPYYIADSAYRYNERFIAIFKVGFQKFNGGMVNIR
jgi:hypothetical protein